MERNSNAKDLPGVQLLEVVTVIFVILKLTDNIDWSWWWIFSPVWILVVVITSLSLTALIVHSVRRLISKIRRK